MLENVCMSRLCSSGSNCVSIIDKISFKFLPLLLLVANALFDRHHIHA